jgi:hypothetical protein
MKLLIAEAAMGLDLYPDKRVILPIPNACHSERSEESPYFLAVPLLAALAPAAPLLALIFSRSSLA